MGEGNDKGAGCGVGWGGERKGKPCYLEEAVGAGVAVDAAALGLVPAQHHQVELAVAFIHQVTGVPVITQASSSSAIIIIVILRVSYVPSTCHRHYPSSSSLIL